MCCNLLLSCMMDSLGFFLAEQSFFDMYCVLLGIMIVKKKICLEISKSWVTSRPCFFYLPSVTITVLQSSDTSEAKYFVLFWLLLTHPWSICAYFSFFLFLRPLKSSTPKIIVPLSKTVLTVLVKRIILSSNISKWPHKLLGNFCFFYFLSLPAETWGGLSMPTTMFLLICQAHIITVESW